MADLLETFVAKYVRADRDARRRWNTATIMQQLQLMMGLDDDTFLETKPLVTFVSGSAAFFGSVISRRDRIAKACGNTHEEVMAWRATHDQSPREHVGNSTSSRLPA